MSAGVAKRSGKRTFILGESTLLPSRRIHLPLQQPLGSPVEPARKKVVQREANTEAEETKDQGYKHAAQSGIVA